MNRREFLRAAVLAGAGGALAACGGASSAAGRSGASNNLIPANLGIVTGINSAEIYYGQSRKLFQAHGIDPRPISFQNAVTMRDALIAGKIDLAAQAPFHVYLSQARGIPLKIVGNRRNLVDVALLVRRDLTGSVRSVADLEGRSVAVQTIGAWDWAIITQYLRKGGLDPSSDVRFVATQNGSTLLQARQVDASEGNPPQNYQMSDGGAGVLVNPFDTAVHQRYFGAQQVMSRAWLTHQRVIDQKPKLVAGVVAATKAIFAEMQRSSDADLVGVIRPYYKGVSQSVLERSVSQDLRQAMPKDSTMSQAAFDADQQIFLNAGLIKRKIPFEAAVDTRWAGGGT